MRSRPLLLVAALVVGALCRCDCEPDNLGEIRCEYNVEPHDQAGSSNAIDFGTIAFGERRTRTVALSNTGSVPLSAVSFDFSGQNGDNYELGATIPTLNVGDQISVPIMFVPQIVASEINHTVVVKHEPVQNVPCNSYTISLRGGSFARPDAGPDAGLDAGHDAGWDGGHDAGEDAGPFIPFADAGTPFDGSGAFVAVLALQDPRSHFGAASVGDGGILVGGGYGANGGVLDSLERFDVASGLSSIVARFAGQQGRAQLTATRMADGRVVFIGGLLPGAEDVALPTGEAIVFVPASTTLVPALHAVSPRFGHTAVAIGDQDVLVAFGETRSGPGQPVEVVGDPVILHLDVSAPTLVTEAQTGAAAPRAETTATLLADGRVIYVGGRDQSGLPLGSVVFFENGQLHTTALALAEPRYGHGAALLGDGRILIVGGIGASERPLTTAEVLTVSGDPATWSAATARDDLAPRLHPLLGLVDPQAVLVAGGGPASERADAGPQRSRDDAVLLFALGSQLVMTAPGNGLAAPRHRAELVMQAERAIILGGSATTLRRSPLPSVESFALQRGLFEDNNLLGPGSAVQPLTDGRLLQCGGIDPHTGTTTARSRFYAAAAFSVDEGPSLLVARRDHSATLIDYGVLLIAGGLDRSGAALAATEIIDLNNGLVSAGHALQNPRSQHSATLLADGTVLICGGLNAGGAPIESCEVYDPGDQTELPEDDTVAPVLGFMSAPRNGHQATLLDDGRVLLSGGLDPARGVRHDDLYDPQAAALLPVAAAPAIARRHHAAVLVGQGRVLLAGGEEYNGAYIASNRAELYDAATDQYLELPPLVTPRIAPAAILFQGGVVMLSGGVRPTSDNPLRPTQALVTSEIFDPLAGQQGDFVAADFPLRAARGMAISVQLVDQPLVLLGESRDGRIAGGAEQRTPHVTMERFDPEAR